MNPPDLRVGMGHDTHRLEMGRPLVLGGVSIEFDHGLAGHSDADVLLHAIIDALLGAAGLGDIGEEFPNTDAQFAGIDSAELLKRTWKKVHAERWQVMNLDCTIHAQQPKLAPYKPQIRRRLAELLGIDEAVVNVKAKTGEHVGPIGRGESMDATAVVLLWRENS